MEKLAGGYYLFSAGKREGEEVDLANVYSAEQLEKIKALYEDILDSGVNWAHEDVSYSSLPAALAARGSQYPEAILDVTAVRKRHLADLVALCLERAFPELCTFDLLEKPNHERPWETLLHELVKRNGFQYVNLLETPIFRETAGRIIRKRYAVLSLIGLTTMLVLGAGLVYWLLGEDHVIAQLLFLSGSMASIASLLAALILQQRPL